MCLGTYVNFYFRKKKVALHRLLYINFIGHLDDDEYLKFNCENKGKCCNVHHMNKFKYNTIEQPNDTDNNTDKRNDNTHDHIEKNKHKVTDTISAISSKSSGSNELILAFE